MYADLEMLEEFQKKTNEAEHSEGQSQNPLGGQDFEFV
jgi:hypothetical protein